MSTFDDTPKIQDIAYTGVVKVRAREKGNRYYFSIRKVDVEFWGIKAGDQVLIQITKLKKTPPGENR